MRNGVISRPLVDGGDIGGRDGIEFLMDADLRERAKAEFDEKMKDQPYVSPVARGQKPLMPED
jgi:hypothetical protein